MHRSWAGQAPPLELRQGPVEKQGIVADLWITQVALAQDKFFRKFAVK
jgi:hypothetical protein